MGFGLQTARTGLRYRNPVIERTAISRVSKNFRGDPQPGKVAMPRGPRESKLRRSTADGPANSISVKSAAQCGENSVTWLLFDQSVKVRLGISSDLDQFR
jgi:hypothetical protein